jgi:hypothetical protein
MDRPVPSKVLADVERDRRAAEAQLSPAERVQLAWELSQEMRMLFWAGLRAQGFAEDEIEELYSTRTP